MKKLLFISILVLLLFSAIPCLASDMPAHSDVVVWEEDLAENIHITIYDDDFMYITGWGELDCKDFDFFNITDCYIEEGFTSIADGAFQYAPDLDYIHLPDSLIRIGADAFYACSLGDVVLPPNLEYIGRDAFHGGAYGTLTINGNNLVIERNAFAMCQALEKVISVTKTPVTIDSLVFFADISLEELTFKGPVSFIGDKPFQSCNSLKALTLGEGTAVLTSNIFYDIHTINLTLPSTLQKIEDNTISYKTFNVNYYGTPEDWDKIEIGASNPTLTKDKINFLGRPEPEISVTINGKVLFFDQPPVLTDGRTLVPLRAIFTELGADIQWDDATKTVTATKGENVIIMQIGNAAYTVNGEQKTLDVPAQLINDRTLIPVRAVAESFNCTVNWQDETKTVEIFSN